MKLSRLASATKRALYINYQLYIANETPVAIYCSGRVGSIALYNALKQADIFALKLEALKPDHQPRGTERWFYEHIVQPQRQTKIITPVREPMAMLISDFFNKLFWLTGEYPAWESHTTEDLINLFNTKYFAEHRHLSFINWFDQQMHPALGIDAYTYPFSQIEKHTQFTQDNYDILILRVDMDDTHKSKIIADFCNIPQINIQRGNESKQKIFADAYADFKSQVVVDEAHLNTVYTSRYAQHFFTAEEIAKHRDRWS